MTPPAKTEGDPGPVVGAGVTPFQADADATIRLAVRRRGARLRPLRHRRGLDQRRGRGARRRSPESTSRIGLATAVLPVWSRTPAAIAMAAASLQRASARPLRPRPRREQPAARRGPARTHLGAADRSDAHHARRRQSAARRRSPAARPRRRQGAAAGRAARVAASRSSSQRSPPPRSGWRVSSQTTGCRSSGPARDSPTVEPCSPRAKRLPRTRRRPGSAPASRSRSARTRRRPGRSPPVGCSPTSHAWVPCIRGCSGITSDSPTRSMRCSAPTRAAGRRSCPRRRSVLAREVTVMGTYDEAPDVVRRWLEAGRGRDRPGVAVSDCPKQQLHEMLQAAAPGDRLVRSRRRAELRSAIPR